jgi:hypothetical protein
MLVRHLRLLVPAIAFLLLVATVARADIEKLAKHLHKLDPGGTGICSPGAGDEAAELLDNYLNEWRAEAARKAALTERSAPLMPPDE